MTWVVGHGLFPIGLLYVIRQGSPAHSDDNMPPHFRTFCELVEGEENSIPSLHPTLHITPSSSQSLLVPIVSWAGSCHNANATSHSNHQLHYIS